MPGTTDVENKCPLVNDEKNAINVTLDPECDLDHFKR